MKKEDRRFLADLIRDVQSIDFVRPEDIPNIDLYMDQVTSFMEDQLEACKRYDTDKILTKTMINNYSKNNLLPPSEKKKYSREHMLTLIFIYYFKNILSISDISSILNPITDKYFGNKDGFNMLDVYEEVFSLSTGESEKLLKDLAKKYYHASHTFSEFPDEDKEFLHAFSFICSLSFDVYLKKMIIENIIDDLNERKKNNKDDDETNADN